MGAPVLHAVEGRLPYSALKCPVCAAQIHTAKEAAERPQRGVTPQGEAAYTSWCKGCRKHFNWFNEPELENPDAITREEFYRRVKEDFGDPGVWAAESMCLDADDYECGYQHCVDKIAPALEEELMANGGDAPTDPFGEMGPEAVLDQFLIK